MLKFTVTTIVVLALAGLAVAADVPRLEVFGGFSYMAINGGSASSSGAALPAIRYKPKGCFEPCRALRMTRQGLIRVVFA